MKSGFFSKLWSARFPIINDRAFNKIDLPEPVSPVIVENPLKKSISNESINAKFFIETLVSKIIIFESNIT